MSHPLPLVTVTFTTDEMAKMSAGLLLLRKRWTAVAMHTPNDPDDALVIVEEITDLINRVAGLISKEQGQALLSGLIRIQREET